MVDIGARNTDVLLITTLLSIRVKKIEIHFHDLAQPSPLTN